MAKKGLGRGLSALLESTADEMPYRDAGEKSGLGLGLGLMVDIRKIEPNKHQPRQYFNEEALNELAESMKTFGVVQPLIVKDNGDYYSIIAGERRYRAARIAKLEELPVIVKDYSDMEILQIALIENIQRQDLTPIEEAFCYRRLIDDFFFTADSIAEKVGKNKHAVSGTLLLLELDPRVRELAAEGQLTASHAKVLLALDGDTQLYCAEKIIAEGLSVRNAESLVANTLKNMHEKEKEDAPEDVLYAFRRAEDELKVLLGSKVNIKPGKKKGRIEIEYYSAEELERLLYLFKKLK